MFLPFLGSGICYLDCIPFESKILLGFWEIFIVILFFLWYSFSSILLNYNEVGLQYLIIDICDFITQVV